MWSSIVFVRPLCTARICAHLQVNPARYIFWYMEVGSTPRRIWWYLKKFYLPSLSVPPLRHSMSASTFHSICVSVYSMFLLGFPAHRDDTVKHSLRGEMAQPRTRTANQSLVGRECRHGSANAREARSDLGPAAAAAHGRAWRGPPYGYPVSRQCSAS